MATDYNASASACVDAYGSAVGMPQLCPEYFGNQIFWLVVALVAIFLILSRVALPRIASVLAERAGTISNDVMAAEEMKSKAEQAEAAYTQALADAKAEAQAIAEQTREEIKAQLADAVAKADAEIAAKAAESEAAIAEIRAGAADSVDAVAKDVAAAVVAALGGKSEAADVNAAVEAQLKG